MSLQTKYQELIDYVRFNSTVTPEIAEQNGVLYITTTVNEGSQKDEAWAIYNRIDPDMRAGDLVLNVSTAGPQEQTYTVQSGDNLSTIAKKYSGISWKDIFEVNKDQIKDPDKIFPGQVLKIPVS